MWKLVFALLIPVARGLWTAMSRESFRDWLSTAYFDILVLLIVVGVACLRWHEQLFRMDEKGLLIQTGLIRKKNFFIENNNISTLISDRPLHLRIIGAVRLTGDTNAAAGRNADFDITVWKKDAEIVFDKRCELYGCEDEEKKTYKPHSLYLALFSALLSNSLTGALLISTFLSQSGAILGRQLEGMFMQGLSDISQVLAGWVPPILTFLAVIIVIGWLIAFVQNLLRYMLFSASRIKKALSLDLGILAKRTYFMLTDKINYIDIRQGMFTKLFRISTTYIYCAGYGKDGGTSPVLIPSSSRGETLSALKTLCPERKICPRKIKPGKFRNIWGFVWLPALLLAGDALLGIAMSRILPRWGAAINFAALMFSSPCVWMFAVKIMDFFSAGVGREGDEFTLYYSSAFSLHTVLIAKSKITEIQIQQSIFKRRANRCKLIVHSYSEKRKAHTLRNMYIPDVREIFGLNAF
jgi:uncharacterized membrane protein YdbT with pleckstrin-like domain